MLFLLKPTEVGEKFISYECVDGFIIRAETPAEARKIAQTNGSGEKIAQYVPRIERAFWLDPVMTTCEEISSEGEIGIVLCSNTGS